MARHLFPRQKKSNNDWKYIKQQNVVVVKICLRNKDLKSKVRRISLKWILLKQLKWILEKPISSPGNISPGSFTLGWAFHSLPNPHFSWFACVMAKPGKAYNNETFAHSCKMWLKYCFPFLRGACLSYYGNNMQKVTIIVCLHQAFIYLSGRSLYSDSDAFWYTKHKLRNAISTSCCLSLSKLYPSFTFKSITEKCFFPYTFFFNKENVYKKTSLKNPKIWLIFPRAL